MIRTLIAALAALVLAACARTSEPADLDAIARDYLLLQLTIGEKEEGYIDAYYGPPEIQVQAKAEAAANDLPKLTQRTAVLRERIAAGPQEEGSLEERRAKFLDAQLVAAQTRLRMMQGENLPFADEAEGLFGVRPETPDLASFDPLIARIDALVPGEGPLWQRIDTFNNRFNIPAGKVKAVMDASIAECRKRTLAHYTLPQGERFELALVTDKPWSGYNYYQGGYHSKIEINTDLPMRIDRAIDLGCHEGYPGHHVFNALMEQELVERRGWLEYTVYPLYSPQSLIAEGSANYGIELAFPGDDALAFDRTVLAPLAGLPGDDIGRYLELAELSGQLQAARYTIAAQLLSGKIDEAEATALIQRYQLSSPERAAQSLRFIRTYRSYIINYGLGKDMVQHSVEAAGTAPDARWARMKAILSEPTLPADLN
ncbi:MAG TPA: hypothetical protein VI168_04340 [Croceibacterium sp.]